ncbi:hypothetical protein ACFYZE_28535 [Streptomyces sp. NPDC001796]|uniref:hypothetical protein n=1 Tax=Streptomyces sp. NPDC001796 TaxID=3364609 RepID=UPI003693732C
MVVLREVAVGGLQWGEAVDVDQGIDRIDLLDTVIAQVQAVQPGERTRRLPTGE